MSARYPNRDVEIPEEFVAPDHVPDELVRDYQFLKIMEPNTHVNPFELGKRAFDEDVPRIFYSPNMVAGFPESTGGWVLTRMDDIKDFMTGPNTSTHGIAGFQYTVGETWPLIPLGIDPPDHRKYRDILDGWVSPKAVAGMEDFIRATADELINGITEREGCDFHYEFARIFPVKVFMKLMGFPPERFDDFLDWGLSILHSKGDIEKIQYGAGSALAYLRGFIEETRANPRDDLVTHVVNAEIDGRPLTDDETIGIIFFVWIGGLDTVAASLNLMFRRLALEPELQRQLRGDMGLIPSAVEEFLRTHPIVSSGRRVTEDMEIHGQPVKAGDYVFCYLGAAHFDPEANECPHEMQLDRKPCKHFTFSAGPHRCMGSHLARKELAVALERWLTLVPEFRLEEEPDMTVYPMLLAAPSVNITWS